MVAGATLSPDYTSQQEPRWFTWQVAPIGTSPEASLTVLAGAGSLELRLQTRREEAVADSAFSAQHFGSCSALPQRFESRLALNGWIMSRDDRGIRMRETCSVSEVITARQHALVVGSL